MKAFVNKVLLSILGCFFSINGIAETFTFGGLNFRILEGDKNVAVIAKSDGSKYTGTIRVPATAYAAKSYKVTAIDGEAFKECTSLSAVYIAEGVSYIGASAFYGCTNLQTVNLPSTITYIRERAFSGCTKLSDINLNNGLLYIYDEGFKDCVSISSITFPKSLKLVGYRAFDGCNGLVSVDIPDGCTARLEPFAFHSCKNLESISIGDQVDIYDRIAVDCPKLTKVSINCNDVVTENYENSSNGITSIFGDQVESYIIGDNVEKIGNYVFRGCQNMKYISLGSGLKEIGNGSFQNCTGITEIIISGNVKSIGNYAFQGCSNVQLLNLGNNVTTIGDYAFQGCSLLSTLNIGNAGVSTSIGNYAFQGCSALGSINLSDGISNIGDYAFSGCCINSISIPMSVNTLGKSAFADIPGLLLVSIDSNHILSSENKQDSPMSYYFGEQVTEYIFGSNVKEIKSSAFESLTNIQTIRLGDGVSRICSSAFSGCSGLSNIYWGHSSRFVEEKAFNNILNVKRVIVPDIAAWCKSSFANRWDNPTFYTNSILLDENTEIIDITIPEGVSQVGSAAFFSCKHITSITLPNSIVSINDHAFDYCENLSSILIPEDLKINKIGAYAFRGCKSLTSVTIPNNVNEIGDDAYSNCSGLTSVHIPDKVTTIQQTAFFNCKSLITVTLGSSVRYIGKLAFSSCPQINFLRVKNPTPIEVPNYEPFDNPENIDLYVPTGCKELYQRATFWKKFKSISEEENANIQFTDAVVKSLCVQNWDANSDGELSKEEAAAVTDISSVFQNKSGITSFNELQYFTGLTSIPNQAFEYCTNLSSIVIPANVKSIGGYAFNHCDNLATLAMPESITSIGNGVLSSCGNLTSVTLPSDITMIPEAAFWGCTKLTSITIPTGVTSIGASAFRECKALTEIVIPNNVVSIGTFAFNSCNNLSTITVGEKVETIANNAFLNCAPKKVTVNSNTLVSKNYSTSSSLADLFTDKVESYVLGNNITKIGDYAFYKCFQLREITLPSGLTYIGVNAFNYCNYLSSIVIPSSVTFLGAGAFNYCSGLTSVTVGWATPLAIGETDFSNRKNATLNVPQGSVSAYKAADYWKEFKNITSGTNVIDLSTATVELSYSESSFSYSGKQIKPTVTSVKINGSAKNISDFNITYGENVNAGNGAIYLNGKNDELYTGTATVAFTIGQRDISNATVSNIPTQEFTGSPIEPTFTVTDGNPSIITTNDYTISYSNNIEPGEATITLTGKNNYKATKKVTFTISQTIIVIDPNDVVVTGVPETVLEGQDPDISKISVSYKGERLIRNLDYEISVNKPNKTITITFIGKYSGQITYNYTEVHVEKIAFADAKVKALCVQYWDTNGDGELSIEEAASITSIDGVFAYNTSINTFEELQYFTGLKQIGSSAFSDCSGLTSITLPTSIERIERFAFSGCVGITSLSIPEGVRFIGTSAFENCSGISVLNLGDNVNTIESDAFRNCSSLTAMVIPNGVTTIEPRTFQYCENLTTVVIPDAVATIGERAFDGCKALTTAALPGSLKTIGGDVFTECMFKSVVIPEGVISIGSRAFYHCTSLTSLTLPNSLTEIGYSAFQFASLKNIISNIENPFVIESSVFSTSNYNTATLNVPVGTVGKYRSTAAWNKFVNITDGSTGINGVYDSTSSDEKYYDVNGIRQSNLKKGLNIVKNVNGQTRKIIIK